MHSTTRYAALAAILAIVTVAGCSLLFDEAEPTADEQMPVVEVAQRSGTQPRTQPGATRQPSDAPRTSLIRSIWDALAQADGIDDSTGDSARQILSDSDKVLARIQEENREAIRQLNRQQRVRRCKTPNIVLIVADDLGYGDLGCYGQEKIKTPRIDQMAAEGIRFTDFYAGNAIGAPSRCALMTGLTSGHGLIRGPRVIPLRPEDITVAEVLWQGGYTTGIMGKWGLGDEGTTGVPNRQGFEHFFGYLTREHAEDYYPDYMYLNEERVTIEANRDGKEVVYSQDLITRAALEFIERAHHQPFFLYVAYDIPHVELEVPTDAPYTNEDWPQWAKNYAAMITRMDGDVGKILDRLDELCEDTIVFFTSDNGPHKEGGADPAFFQSAGPLRGMKGDLYEGGIRVPMIVWGRTRIQAGVVSEEPWAFWDFLPTAAELTDCLWRPHHIDGVSMVPALHGGTVPYHPGLYWELHDLPGGPEFQQAYRTGNWKAVRPNAGRPLELYDLENDIGEQNNVAAQNREIVDQIERDMAASRTDSAEWPVPRN